MATEKKKKKKEKKETTVFDSLSIKHKEFVINYLETLNATKAYQKAYPSSNYNASSVGGFNLLRNPKIKNALKEYYNELWDNKDDYIGVLFKKLLNIVDFDISSYVDDDGNICLDKINKENSFPISEVTRKVTESKYGTNIQESIKTVDKLKAISELAKVLNMIQEKMTVNLNYDKESAQRIQEVFSGSGVSEEDI